VNGLETPLTKLLGIRYPIIEGGLAHLGYAGLAAAISNAGALGQITAATLPDKEALREEIRKTRGLTDSPFGVNVAMGTHSMDDFVTVAMEEEVPVLTISGGNPEQILSRTQGKMCRVVMVGSVRAAKKAEILGAEAVIAAGFESGGHIGRSDTTTMVLVPRIADAIKIPVVAAGGIADGRGLTAALMLGAAGVQLGTRFVATKECMAHPNYKNALVEAGEDQTLIIKRSIGRPARALKTHGAEKVVLAEEANKPAEEILEMVRGEINRTGALEGRLDEAFVWAGQVCSLIDDVPSAQDLINRLVQQALELMRPGGQAPEAG